MPVSTQILAAEFPGCTIGLAQEKHTCAALLHEKRYVRTPWAPKAIGSRNASHGTSGAGSLQIKQHAYPEAIRDCCWIGFSGCGNHANIGCVCGQKFFRLVSAACLGSPACRLRQTCSTSQRLLLGSRLLAFPKQHVLWQASRWVDSFTMSPSLPEHDRTKCCSTPC